MTSKDEAIGYFPSFGKMAGICFGGVPVVLGVYSAKATA